MIDFNEYQKKAATTSLNTKIGDCEFLYPVLGLANEAGEVCGKIKKLFRDKGGKVDEEFLKMIKAELGDVQWYLAETCTKFGLSLEEVAAENIDKLFSRKERGVIKGSGDTR